MLKQMQYYATLILIPIVSIPICSPSRPFHTPIIITILAPCHPHASPIRPFYTFTTSIDQLLAGMLICPALSPAAPWYYDCNTDGAFMEAIANSNR